MSQGFLSSLRDFLRLRPGYPPLKRWAIFWRPCGTSGCYPNVLPAPIRRDLPILVAAKGERMLRLTVELADLWQTAWFGLPDERYRGRHSDLLAACTAGERDPSSIGITVGVDVVEDDPGPNALALDAGVIADALHAWDAEAADHIQLGVRPATPATYAVVLDGIRRYRG